MTRNDNLPSFPNADCGDFGSRLGPIVAIGERLNVDTLSAARGLLCGDIFSSYRYPIFGAGPVKCVAIEVRITGRVAQDRTDGSRWIRAQVEFVGDGEPSTFAKGWVRVR